MGEYQGFENLECWRQAKDLAVDICRISPDGGKNGDGEVALLLRRSAIEVMTRIAAGKERRGPGGEFLQHLQMARGAAAAFRSGLVLGRDIGILAEGDYLEYLDRAHRISALIGGLINAIRKNRRDRDKDRIESSAPEEEERPAEVPF